MGVQLLLEIKNTNKYKNKSKYLENSKNKENYTFSSTHAYIGIKQPLFPSLISLFTNLLEKKSNELCKNKNTSYSKSKNINVMKKRNISPNVLNEIGDR